ncbi:MAG TPA: DUF998 domain-containing protein [Gemmatimonadaceae bacterium]|nr:DUF998 domain-containing protein [Gemmatimonadaceae bacterium]
MRPLNLPRRLLLACGIAGAALYPLADIVAALRYPGFSYRDQAVSELFAIGAPTSGLVVPLFSVSSTLLLLFAIGIRLSAHGRRAMQWMAVMMALNTIDALVLWNFFPAAHARVAADGHRHDGRQHGRVSRPRPPAFDAAGDDQGLISIGVPTGTDAQISSIS